jgi:glycosyltransferase involved in cell wall biosynthesis
LPTLLSINNYYYPRGGAEVVFLEHNRAFQEHGWNVVPFSMSHQKNLESKWDKYFVEEIEYGENYSFGELIRKIPKTIYSFEARRKLDELLSVKRPSIAHAHNIYHHLSPAILGLLRKRGIPVVLTVHDLKIACAAYNMLAQDGVCERCKNGRVYNVILHRCIKNSLPLSGIVMLENVLHRILRSYVKNVNVFISPSLFYIRKLADWGFDVSSFVHVPNFVDVVDVVPGVTTGKSFLYFGRLSKEKGISTFIKAAVKASVPVWIVGDGAEERSIRTLSEELGGNIKFFGFLSGEKLHNVIRSSRAVVLPSEWYENAPVSVLEAYALGKPVVGARIGGIPELIRDGETGYTFESGSVDDLASTLETVRDLPDSKIDEMGKYGRNWVEKEFTLKLYVQRVQQIYRELGVQNKPV